MTNFKVKRQSQAFPKFISFSSFSIPEKKSTNLLFSELICFLEACSGARCLHDSLGMKLFPMNSLSLPTSDVSYGLTLVIILRKCTRTFRQLRYSNQFSGNVT